MPIPNLKIIKDKSGIYMITNTITKKRYIGKSSNLLDRFKNYSSLNFLKEQHNSLICKALLRFGLSNFSVVIIETGESSTLSEREQYFINAFEPQYNVRKVVNKPLNHLKKHANKACSPTKKP